jgi:flagellar motor switch protein FliN
MSETLAKQFISNFSNAWNEIAPGLLGQDSALGLLALREVTGDGVQGALAVANTWSSAFAAPCSGGMGGVVVCLFKTEDGDTLDKAVKHELDGSPKPGSRLILSTTLADVVFKMAAAAEPTEVSFGSVSYMDLSQNEERLTTIVGNAVWVGTFSLSIGDDLETQALMLYAPDGALAAQGSVALPAEDSKPAQVNNNAPLAVAQNAAAAAPAPTATRRGATRREETPAPKNIERLLEVDLDVVVRFGVTNMPLREVVRMGTGTMVELDRSVDEPVELLVNGRPFARGEVVVIDGYYGVRITEIGSPTERTLSLT